MSLSIIVAFELFFGDEYWKQCTLLCLNIHLQWKAKKRRWFKNSLMSWAFKVAKQMWDCVAIYTQQLKGVKKLKVEFLCLVLSYIITLSWSCKFYARENQTQKSSSQLLYSFKLLCIGGQRNLKFVWPLWLLSVSLSSFHLESSLFRLTIFRTLFVTLLIKVRMHVEPSLNITVDIVQRFFLNLEFEGRMTDRGEVNI